MKQRSYEFHEQSTCQADCISQDSAVAVGQGYFPGTGRAGFYCYHRCCEAVSQSEQEKLMREGQRGGGEREREEEEEEASVGGDTWEAGGLDSKCE